MREFPPDPEGKVTDGLALLVIFIKHRAEGEVREIPGQGRWEMRSRGLPAMASPLRHAQHEMRARMDLMCSGCSRDALSRSERQQSSDLLAAADAVAAGLRVLGPALGAQDDSRADWGTGGSGATSHCSRCHAGDDDLRSDGG